MKQTISILGVDENNPKHNISFYSPLVHPVLTRLKIIQINMIKLWFKIFPADAFSSFTFVPGQVSAPAGNLKWFWENIYSDS